MTTSYSPRTPVTHPRHGVGCVVRMWGHTLVEVQWPGLPYTRREPLADVTPYVPPAPTRRRRAAS